MYNRRKFLKFFFSTLSAGASSLAYAHGIEPHWVDWNSVPMPLQNGSSLLQGRSLIQISDLHIGSLVSATYLKETFLKIQSLDADYIVITGDFISYKPGIEKDLSELLRFFPKGKKQTFAILGNHDYGFFFNDPEVANDLSVLLKEQGITVLRNEHRLVDGIQWIGIDDLWSKRIDLQKSFRNCSPDIPSIILAHNPDTIDHPLWPNHFKGWILSGHTHGGQCRLPLLSPPILPVKNRAYASGKVQINLDQTLYVNRGLGHLTKLRFCARPEVTIFS